MRLNITTIILSVALIALILAAGCRPLCTVCNESIIINKTPQLKECMGYSGGNVCTMEYMPVCGKLSAGGWKTFSNPCVACTSGEVDSYKEGECSSVESG